MAEFLAEDNDELYLSNSSDIFAHHPELMDDLDIKRLSKPFPGYIHYQSDIHVARNSRNRANMHCAPGLNLFAQIRGRKRWTFVAPEWTPFVYPLANELPFYGMSIWGEENAKRYPLLARVPRLDVVLEPGDLLLSPPCRHTSSSAPTSASRSPACSGRARCCRWPSTRCPGRTCPTMSAMPRATPWERSGEPRKLGSGAGSVGRLGRGDRA